MSELEFQLHLEDSHIEQDIKKTRACLQQARQFKQWLTA